MRAALARDPSDTGMQAGWGSEAPEKRKQTWKLSILSGCEGFGVSQWERGGSEEAEHHLKTSLSRCWAWCAEGAGGQE